MKTHHIIKAIGLFAVFILATLAAKPLAAQNAGVFTQSDRELLIRLEDNFESSQKQPELTIQRIVNPKSVVKGQGDDLRSAFNPRFGEVMTFMYRGFGIVFTMMIILMGFVQCNGRTTIAPFEIRHRRVEEVMIEFAKIDPKFKEILRKAASGM